MDEQKEIPDTEILYRRVPNSRHFFSVTSEHGLKLTSAAFNDPAMRPSVDLSSLRASPEESKTVSSQGIAMLITSEVRSIATIAVTDPRPDEPTTYAVDVYYRPVRNGNPDGQPENLAHAQIESSPLLASNGRFNKLKDALARLASKHGWLVEPT